MAPRTGISAAAIVVLLVGCTPSVSPTPKPGETVGVTPATSETAAPPATPGLTSPPLPQGSDPPTLDPADFEGVAVDHPFWPMTPGSKWVYRETDAEGAELTVEVTVTDETREILEITATVVHDVVTEDGEVVEDTFDWYAQDRFGNLWYLGEDTKELEGGKIVSTAGSWEAGVEGALAGIILPGDPQVGQRYRQEYRAGEAEDQGEILALGAHVDVPFGTFDGCIQTKDTTPLEPDFVENKWYAPGVGPVEAMTVSGGTDHEVLLTFEPGGG